MLKCWVKGSRLCNTWNTFTYVSIITNPPTPRLLTTSRDNWRGLVRIPFTVDSYVTFHQISHGVIAFAFSMRPQYSSVYIKMNCFLEKVVKSILSVIFINKVGYLKRREWRWDLGTHLVGRSCWIAFKIFLERQKSREKLEISSKILGSRCVCNFFSKHSSKFQW